MNKIITPDDAEIDAGDLMDPTTLDDASLAIGLSRAEIDTQIATARRFPRSLAQVRKRLLDLVTLDEQTAEECMYALPRNGKPITGPSIRFAEALKAAFGNCRAASRIVFVDRVEKVVIAEGLFHDLETNSASRAEVRRRIVDKRGRLFSDDMIVVTGNAACSIALRNAVLGGVPRPIWRASYDTALRVVAGDLKTLTVNRDKALKAFAVFGVTPERVFEALGVGGEIEISLEHIPILRGMFATLKNGEATVEEMFGGKPTGAAEHAVVADPLNDAPPTPEPTKAPEVPRQVQRNINAGSAPIAEPKNSVPPATTPPPSEAGASNGEAAATADSQPRPAAASPADLAFQLADALRGMKTAAEIDRFWAGVRWPPLSSEDRVNLDAIRDAFLGKVAGTLGAEACGFAVQTQINDLLDRWREGQ